MRCGVTSGRGLWAAAPQPWRRQRLAPPPPADVAARRRGVGWGSPALPPHQQDLLMGSGGERALCSLVRARGRGPEASAARCSAAASASVAEGNDWPRRSFGPNRGARYLTGGTMRRASPRCRRGVAWLDCELLGPAADTTGFATKIAAKWECVPSQTGSGCWQCAGISTARAFFGCRCVLSPRSCNLTAAWLVAQPRCSVGRSKCRVAKCRAVKHRAAAQLLGLIVSFLTRPQTSV